MHIVLAMLCLKELSLNGVIFLPCDITKDQIWDRVIKGMYSGSDRTLQVATLPCFPLSVAGVRPAR